MSMTNNLQIVSVIAVIRNSEGKYLLVQRSANDDILPLKWQNLGGKVEIGERIEFALLREIEEEVGIKLSQDIIPIFLQSYSWKKDEESPYRLGLIFLFSVDNKQVIKLSDELNNFGWFDVSEIETLDTIGKDSPTGTLGQIKQAEINKKNNSKSI